MIRASTIRLVSLLRLLCLFHPFRRDFRVVWAARWVGIISDATSTERRIEIQPEVQRIPASPGNAARANNQNQPVTKVGYPYRLLCLYEQGIICPSAAPIEFLPALGAGVLMSVVGGEEKQDCVTVSKHDGPRSDIRHLG